MKRLLLATLFSAAPYAGAETLYVIERLTVSVNDAPDGAGSRIATVRSGDQVEVLEQLDDAARVRLANGTEGWMQAAYLSADRPLRHQLTERTRELEAAREQLSRAERELAAARELQRTATAAAAAPQGIDEAALMPTQRPLFPSRVGQDTRPTWLLLAAASVLALGAGFAIGWRVLDRRIRRKYGGLRIY